MHEFFFLSNSFQKSFLFSQTGNPSHFRKKESPQWSRLSFKQVAGTGFFTVLCFLFNSKHKIWAAVLYSYFSLTAGCLCRDTCSITTKRWLTCLNCSMGFRGQVTKGHLISHWDSNCPFLHLIHSKKQRWGSISQGHYNEAYQTAHQQQADGWHSAWAKPEMGTLRY